MQDERKALGKKGEKIAEKFLKRRGYKIVERNYRCRFGEVDLIAVDGECLVFVEVKTRRDGGSIPPQLAVDRRKQSRLAHLAAYFLSHNPSLKTQPQCRFDVVAVITDARGKKPSIELFQNAFLPKDTRFTI